MIASVDLTLYIPTVKCQLHRNDSSKTNMSCTGRGFHTAFFEVFFEAQKSVETFSSFKKKNFKKSSMRTTTYTTILQLTQTAFN